MGQPNIGNTIRCSFCLGMNTVNDTICSTCGKPLHSVASTIPVETYAEVNNSVRFDEDISNTITGLLLLAIGTAIAWVPIVKYLGLILNFVGVILIFLNRKEFNSRHSTYVVLSIVIYVTSFITVFYSSSTTTVVGSYYSSGLAQKETLIMNQLKGEIIAAVLSAIIGSIAYFFITIALQDALGKLLLACGLISSFIIELLMGSILYDSISTIVNNAFSGVTYNSAPIKSLINNLTVLSLLGIIPDILFAVAYLRLRSVLDDEIIA